MRERESVRTEPLDGWSIPAVAETYTEEELLGEEKSSKSFVCFRCGKEFKSKKVLMKHVKNSHEDELVDEDTRAELDEELEGA